MTPHTVHQFLLVATNLEIVPLAELVKNTSCAIPEIFDALTGRWILNLFSFENLFGFGRRFRNRLTEHLLEQITHTTGDQFADIILHLGVDFMESDKLVDAGLNRRHLDFGN